MLRESPYADDDNQVAANRVLHVYTQVALLFLTRGPMPLEPVWREFLSAAALLEPVPNVRVAMHPCRACLDESAGAAAACGRAHLCMPTSLVGATN